MTGITTHVLDTVLGKPAVGVAVHLEMREGDAWIAISDSATDVDGRCRELALEPSAGVYRLTFETGGYLSRQGRQTIYPQICITFNFDGESHYHLPLLLSDNSFTTYRGS
jgi:5-hydroxyisourate hydrolase